MFCLAATGVPLESLLNGIPFRKLIVLYKVLALFYEYVFIVGA